MGLLLGAEVCKDLVGSWVDGTTSRTLFNRIVPGQVSPSRSTVGSLVNKPVIVCAILPPTRSLRQLMCGHWMGSWVDRTGAGLWLRGCMQGMS